MHQLTPGSPPIAGGCVWTPVGPRRGKRKRACKVMPCKPLFLLVPEIGIEPTTYALRIGTSQLRMSLLSAKSGHSAKPDSR